MKIGRNAPPIHPRCRCSVVPVVDLDEIKENKLELKENEVVCVRCGKRAASKFGNQVCDECQSEILASKEGKKMAKWGYDDFDIVRYTLHPEQNMRPGNRVALNYLSNLKHQIEQGELKLSHSFYFSRDELEKLKAEYEKISKMSPEEQEKWFKRCKDCGKWFRKNDKSSNRTVRCPECQAKYKAISHADASYYYRERKKKNS